MRTTTASLLHDAVCIYLEHEAEAEAEAASWPIATPIGGRFPSLRRKGKVDCSTFATSHDGPKRASPIVSSDSTIPTQRSA
ncbi:Protein of unknown function [Pyronema omphalodes CBS 100304]|uniref:Uncharacterized protein n=1 Tax=Pyronema omphalodes (strain CBS 100304) TaxID=1076935 RepID=U4LT87_PYROM|nr:Protein of unknown function [Pyronema omphalodes CBS 100304]